MAAEKKENKHKWHSLKGEDVTAKLSTDQKEGLSDGDVSERLERYGRNILPKGRK